LGSTIYCPYIRLGNKSEKNKGIQKLLASLLNDPNIDKLQTNVEERIEDIQDYINELTKSFLNTQEAFDNYFLAIVNFENFKKNELPKSLTKELENNNVRAFEDTILQRCCELKKKSETYLSQFKKNYEQKNKENESLELLYYVKKKLCDNFSTLTVDKADKICKYVETSHIQKTNIIIKKINKFLNAHQQKLKKLEKEQSRLKKTKTKKKDIYNEIPPLLNENITDIVAQLKDSDQKKYQKIIVDIKNIIQYLKFENEKVLLKVEELSRQKENLKKKEESFLKFLNKSFTVDLKEILINEGIVLNSLNADIDLIKLKSNLMSFNRANVSFFKKIWWKLFRKSYENKFWNILKPTYSSLPQQIQNCLSKEYSELFLNNQLKIVEVIQNLSVWQEKQNSIIDSKSDIKEFESQLKNDMGGIHENSELKNLIKSINDISFIFSDEFLNHSPSEFLFDGFDRICEVLEEIKTSIKIFLQYSTLFFFIKKNKKVIQELQTKTKDVYYQPFYELIDIFLSKLPDEIKIDIDSNDKDIKLIYYANLLNEINDFLESLMKIKKLNQEIEAKIFNINKLDNKLRDEYYQTLYFEIDKFLFAYPKKLKNDLYETKIDNKIELYNFIIKKTEKQIVLFCKANIYRKKIKIANKKLKTKLDLPSYESEFLELKELMTKASIKKFNDFIYKSISKSKLDLEQFIKDYSNNWKDSILMRIFVEFTNYIKIWVTTNLSTRFNIPNMPAIFDYLIIDEASQSDIATIIPLLFRAKNLIILGDPNQLKHITSLGWKQIEQISEKYNFGAGKSICLHYKNNSAYDIAERQFQTITGRRPFLLKEHYRCHEEIIGFSNKYIYKSSLFPKKYISKEIKPFTQGVFWENIKGKYGNKNNINEAIALIKIIKSTLKNGLQNGVSIGVITPFNNQKKILSSLLTKQLNIQEHDKSILVSTVHSFQGDEKDIILYSPVMSHGIEDKTLQWLDRSTELLNVAITRARSSFIIVGDFNFIKTTHGLHRQLLDYCEDIRIKKNNMTSFESSTEKLFYQHLSNSGIKFEYQVPIGKYRIDFMLKTLDTYLCIELDGSSHDGKQSYDYSRDKFLNNHGYSILRIPNDYLKENINEIVSNLKTMTCLV